MPLPGNVFPPEVNDSDEFERPLNPNTEGIAARGVYPQNATSADANAGIERDSSGNLVLKDANAGSILLSAVTLSPSIDLLENDPVDAACAFTITETDGDVTRLDWNYTPSNTLKKRTDFTYTDGEVTLEDIKVYAGDGSTIIARLQITYDYSTDPVSITRSRVV